jgi:hypothetical protein
MTYFHAHTSAPTVGPDGADDNRVSIGHHIGLYRVPQLRSGAILHSVDLHFFLIPSADLDRAIEVLER